MRRSSLAGGVAGPVAFAAAWVWGSATSDGYSAVSEPISRLAAVGTPTAPLMTAGLLGFAAGVGAFAAGTGAELPDRVRLAAVATAAASVGIAATPLDGRWGETPHAVAAGAAYASLVALVATGGGPLAAHLGAPRVARGSWVAATASAACLAGSALGPESVTGVLQRLGLTIGHAWIVGAALALGGRRRR